MIAGKNRHGAGYPAPTRFPHHAGVRWSDGDRQWGLMPFHITTHALDPGKTL